MGKPYKTPAAEEIAVGLVDILCVLDSKEHKEWNELEEDYN